MIHRSLAAAAVALVLAVACGETETDDAAPATEPSTAAADTSTPSTDDADTDTPADETSDADTDTDEPMDDAGDHEELFPDVVGAMAILDDDGTWTFSATLSSPYDTPARYADAWRVRDEDGTVFGIRELAHDHADEQPFTRSQSGIEIPDDVAVVIVEGRDQLSGWGGATVTVTLERS